MTQLLSILNSGESLEKAIVLTRLALEGTPDFYARNGKLTVVYYENLPKQDEHAAHGTIGGLLENLDAKARIGYATLADLWEDRETVLKKLQAKERVSDRLKEKLLKDKERFDKMMPRVPWYFVFDDFRDFLTAQFIGDKADVQFLNFKEKAPELFAKLPSYTDGCKLYLLNPDGSTSSEVLWKGRSDTMKTQLKAVGSSIVTSPNVFLFLVGSYYFMCKGKDTSVGFRNFTRQKRKSYDDGIKFIRQRGSVCVEEPRNFLFNSLLDEVDAKHGQLPPERKTTLAVYGYLNKHL